MSYNYQTERQWIFTDEGQRDFLKVRDRVNKLCESAGCVRMQEAMGGIGGSSWQIMACVDRMVELSELKEVIPKYGTPMGQYRIFTKPYSDV